MRILAITQGEYGKRMVQNLRAHAPQGWVIEEWQAPGNLPLVMDYPEEHIPEELPPVDLILSLGENPGVAELIPEIAQRTGAHAVIVPIDHTEWMPKGLARQLKQWLENIGVAAVFPKPLCSLTETHYNAGRHRVEYHNEWIAEFARFFGRPRFILTVDPASKTIIEAHVERDAVCGCARHVAEGLIGVHVDEAEFQAGMLHHHYPCLAAMGIDNDFGDTLMHVSGHITKEEVKAQIKPYLTIQYFEPHGRVEEASDSKPLDKSEANDLP
nr:hypothetical protein [Chloroflexota bacterium]